uniref:Deoxyribonuclease 1 like 2 n=1 Tax=Anas platyrhynchos platyrhynchos TaxID=8840 RepID=A0A493TZX2_ANAPP
MGTAVLALSLLAVTLVCPATATLRIGAFNIQAFGDSKMSDEAVAGVIVNVSTAGDARGRAVCMEPKYSNGVRTLLSHLGCHRGDTGARMTLLGLRTPKPPQQGQAPVSLSPWSHRTDVVSVVDTYQYEDPQDIFSREPFILRVSAPRTSKWEFVMVPLHSAPHDAAAEIDALYDVYLAVLNKWGTDNIVFLGDFNADCAYVKPSDWASIRLRTSDVFKWLIPDSSDTTVGKSDCAYDRIVVCGAKLKRSIVPNSATVYNFQRAFQLEQEEALAVSDHYPVEVKTTPRTALCSPIHEPCTGAAPKHGLQKADSQPPGLPAQPPRSTRGQEGSQEGLQTG